MKNIRHWIPSLAWMSVIFLFSTDLFSINQTASWVEKLIHYLFPSFSNETVVAIHVVIRKHCHVLAYAMLALCYFNGFTNAFTKPVQIKMGVLVFMMCFLYACSDEWHQSFSQARTSSFGDVLYDSLGALLSVCFIVTRVHFLRPRS